MALRRITDHNDQIAKFTKDRWADGSDSVSNPKRETSAFDLEGTPGTRAISIRFNRAPAVRYSRGGAVNGNHDPRSADETASSFESPQDPPTLLSENANDFSVSVNATVTIEPRQDMGKSKYITQIVGGTVGGVVFVALAILLFILYRRRRRRDMPLYYMGPLQASMPMSKEAFTSPRFSHYGISFSPSAPPSTDSLTALPPRTHKFRTSRTEGSRTIPGITIQNL